MKKFIVKICAAFAAVALAFGVSFTPCVAVAETVTGITENSQGTPENSTVETPSDETPEDVGEVEGTPANPTFEDFLAAAQKEAEKYGYGNEYAAAMESIKAAATTKQVTLSTVFSATVALAVIVYIVLAKKKDKTLRKDLAKLLKMLEAQRDGTNALIDEANENEKTSERTNANLKATQEDVKHVEKAIAYLVAAFMAFSEGHKYQDAKKNQVEMNCVKALKEVDGVDDENNKK